MQNVFYTMRNTRTSLWKRNYSKAINWSDSIDVDNNVPGYCVRRQPLDSAPFNVVIILLLTSTERHPFDTLYPLLLHLICIVVVVILHSYLQLSLLCVRTCTFNCWLLVLSTNAMTRCESDPVQRQKRSQLG